MKENNDKKLREECVGYELITPEKTLFAHVSNQRRKGEFFSFSYFFHWKVGKKQRKKTHLELTDVFF